MRVISSFYTRTITQGLAALSLCALASASIAQDVVLRSPDGTVDLSGRLIEYDGNSYVVESIFGPMRVPAGLVECIGDPCPDGGIDQLRSITWSVSLWGKRRAFTEHVERLAELVAAKTEGQFRLNLSYGGLSSSRENLDGISRGAFEMAQFCAGYHPEKNPTLTVLELPFLGVDTMEEELAVSQAVYQHPAVVEDLARWNATLLMPTPQPQYNIVGVGSPPTSIEDFRGMKVRATGGTGEAINALGAESITITAPETREALSNGEVKAVAFAPHAHMAFGTIESAVWWTTNLNPGTANCPIAVNSDALADLPVPYRLALMSSIDEALQHFITNYKGSAISAWETALNERSIITLTFSDALLSSINDEVAGPAAAKWIAENTARGLPAEELYDVVVSALADDQTAMGN